MPYIHQISGWPEFAWDDAALSAPLAAVRHRQGLLLGRMTGLGLDLQAEASLRTWTSDVVRSSAIEGETLNPDEVRSSIARRLGLERAGLPEAGRDVDAVVEMTLDATRRADEPLTKERLCGWHAALFPSGRSGTHRITVGAWRPASAGAMRVVSGPIGMERVHFEAPAADRLADEMARFLGWFNGPPATDPVLHAGVAHFWFVTVHPFEDGNGRIARAIADLALARGDRMEKRYYSMSAQIEAERSRYYDELEAAQRGGLDITRWLLWFVDCLGRAIDRAHETLHAVLHTAAIRQQLNHGPVNERQQRVVERMLDDFKGFMTTGKYAKIAKCSADTALRDIRILLERGVLVQNPGGGRKTSYRLADPPADRLLQ